MICLFAVIARVLVVFLPAEPARLFRLPLSRNPASTSGLGPWRRADHLDDPNDDQPRPAPADDPVEMRFRIRRLDD